MASRLRYNYTHLRPRQIRLLQLFPTTNEDTETDDLRITLEIHNLNTLPHFEALSYVWGTTGLNSPIACQNGNVWVTENCEAALRRLRLPSSKRYIWVDAICINQDELDERSSQVVLMKQIYEAAERTLMWIGPVGEYGDDIAKVFRLLPELAKLWRQQGLDENSVTSIADSKDLVGSELMELDNQDLWLSIQDILESVYFRRMWILQEIIVSRNPFVICGPHELDWMNFQEAVHLIYTCLFVPIKTSNIIYRIRVAQLSYKEKGGSLQPLPYLFQGFEATDPRDYIYALLGFSGSPKGEEPYIAGPIQVDYKKPVHLVFQEAAAHILCDYKDTDLLRLVLPGRLQKPGFKEMPSWVPDFSNGKNFCLTDTYNKSLADLLGKYTKNTVSGPFLSFQGMFVDIISYCTIEISESNIGNVLLNLYSEAHTSAKPYKTGESRIEALWRTLVANMSDDTRQVAPVEYGDGFETWISRLFFEDLGISMQTLIDDPPSSSLAESCPRLRELFPQAFEANIAVSNLIESNVELHQRYTAATRDDEAYQRVAEGRLYFRHNTAEVHEQSIVSETPIPSVSLEKSKESNMPASDTEEPILSSSNKDSSTGGISGGRTFFITKKGYYGLGPLCTSGLIEGCIAVIPAGAYSPYVLQPLGRNCFKVLGSAYMHGINDTSCLKKRGPSLLREFRVL